MKTIKHYVFLLACAAIAILGACSDFLDIVPNDRITGDNFYQNEADFQAATAPLYNKVWFDFNDKFYYGLGDGRSYNLDARYSDYIYPFADLLETGLTSPLVSAWQSLYNVVQQSNRVIIGIGGSDVNAELKNSYVAEARFMRGTAYWYLVSLWGNVIISEDPGALVINPIVNTSPRSDVFEFAIRDLEYAAKWLPETASQNGRLTKYSAFGMLARVYLSYSGLSSNPESHTRSATYLNLARQAAAKVINESKYELMDSYADVFTIENNNNSESMFSLQWVPNGDYGVTNTQQAYFAYGSAVTGDDAAWGGNTWATRDLLLEYSAADTRRKATWMSYGDHYPEIDKANGGLTVEHTRYSTTVKKGVVGSPKDNAAISRMNSSVNTNMLRLAEVYLTYAEAILGNEASTSDAEALTYFNAVRRRAGLGGLASISYEDIRKERRLELCMEGQYWYDLVRRAYYYESDVLGYIQGQDRGHLVPFLYEEGAFTANPDPERETADRTIGNITAKILLLPYPESELIQNPKLREDPLPFTFTEEKITDLFD
jgi:hypothetical protein